MSEQPVNIKAKNYSLDIEWKIRDVFNCERFGMGGIADSDFIKNSPYCCMVATLMYLYNPKGNGNRIENFINKYSYYSNFSIESIINETGEEEFKSIINDFNNLIK